jgi:hypothetical protein
MMGFYYREDWVCAVAHDSPSGDSLSLKQYLAAVGAKRNSCIRVPYFGVALQCVAGTELILTLTSGLTSVVKRDRKLRVVKSPPELHAFHFRKAWHPRHNGSTTSGLNG